MKKKIFRLLALLLAVVMLCGCADTGSFLNSMKELAGAGDYVAYKDMAYTRPDMTALEQSLRDACDAAMGEDLDAILNAIYAFYDQYDAFYTNYSLADIRYCKDLTDLYWEDEYTYCVDNSATVDAGLEELYYTLAKSPCREALEADEYFGAGFFDSYDGENNWDETFTAMLEQEAALQSRYYELSSEALNYEPASKEFYDACGGEMAQLLVDLIALRQEIAAYWGYSDYVQFANDFYYYRDYTPSETSAYLLDIRDELVPMYRQVLESSRWEDGYRRCSEAQTYDYVRTVSYRMGGIVEEAFRLLDQAGLYDISYGENKYDSSFEVYLASYYEPFIFMNPSMVLYDKLTFAHEFGHFCNDYASYGSYAGVDVAEVFSQGMEYLSLCYAPDSEALTWLKMADSLCLFVEQSAFADFEQQMYSLTGSDLTVENLRKLYEEVVLSYGFDAVGYTDWEFVNINHFYTNPMYVISYVVSNDAAMQLYQLELDEPGAGLACFEDNLDTSATYFLEFLEEAGLDSPFRSGRIREVKETFQQILD